MGLLIFRSEVVGSSHSLRDFMCMKVCLVCRGCVCVSYSTSVSVPGRM